jgi:hypothetical protein
VNPHNGTMLEYLRKNLVMNMKNLFILYTVLLFSVIACSREVEDEVLTPSINQPINFIDLFQDSTLVDSIRSITYCKEIGTNGGTLQFEEQFAGGPFGSFSISATIEIEPGTIPVNETFLCQLASHYKKACVYISPVKKHFAHPFKLKLKYTGIELQKVNPNTLDFLCSIGYSVAYASVHMDNTTGTLEVNDALIPYISTVENNVEFGFVD